VLVSAEFRYQQSIICISPFLRKKAKKEIMLINLQRQVRLVQNTT
jgi:hypothetical protein